MRIIEIEMGILFKSVRNMMKWHQQTGPKRCVAEGGQILYLLPMYISDN